MTPVMLRVLTLSTLFPNAGEPVLGVFVERQTLSLAAMDGVGVEVVAGVGLPPWPLSGHPHYAARATLPAEEDWKGLAVHRPRYRVWPRIGSRQTATNMARALLPLLERIRRRFPFDVIDAEFFWPDGVAAMHLSRALKVPFSIKARGSDILVWGRQPEIARQIVAAGNAASGLLAVSEALKSSMADLGMPAERIRVHRTGVDHTLFRPLDRRAAKASLDIAGPLIVTAGALIPRKNQAAAIEALALLPGATMILVGDGPERKRLEALASRLGLDDRVRFVGRRPHAELPPLLGAADLMMLPSVSEGLANVWVESLACGTPIVIADAGGAREVVDRPEAGRIVPGDPESLADGARSILASPSPQEEVRRAAERFCWKENARALKAHLAVCAEA